VVWTQVTSQCVLQQTKQYLLENVHVVLGKACEDDIKTDVMPLLVNGLDTDWPPCHTAALAAVTVMRQCLDDHMMRRFLLPPAKALFSQTANVRVSHCAPC